jgi:anti-sigma regulatory factor (Ser/Thr protein kinase)
VSSPPTSDGTSRPVDLQRIAEVFMTLHASLSVDETMERVVDAARDLIGAHQAVASFTADRDWSQSITAVSLSDRYAAWGDYATPPDGSGVYRIVCEQNRPMRLTQAALEAHPAWRGFGPDAEAHPPMNGWLAAPLVGRDGSNIGLVQLSDKIDGEFAPDDEAVLVQLAQLAAIAVENASLYQREQETARQLQQRLLPEDLPEINGLDIAVRYLPGGLDAEVGGDWYDVIELGGCRVGLVIGDVMGRGVAAASVMGQLRIALRAYALDQLSPGQALRRLARLVDSLDGEYFVTVVYAVWDLQAEALTFATAGHLPPLLRTAEGTVAFLHGDPGLPIGVAPDPEYVEHRLDAPAGSALVLYTDGLVERRDVPLDATLPILARAAHEPQRAEHLVQRVLDTALEPDAPDDIAVLVASRPGAGVRERQQPEDAMTIPADPARVGQVRRWLAACVGDEAGAETLETLSLLASEVITNAVLHAATPVTVSVEREDARVRVCVTDQLAEVPSIAEFTADRSGGRGMGLIDALADDWGVDVALGAKTVWFELDLEGAASADR